MSSGWLHTANVINGDIECKAVEYLQGLGPATEQVARKGGANTLMKYVTSNLPKSSLWQRRLASLCAIRCDIDSILAGPFHPLANLALPDYTRRTGATAIDLWNWISCSFENTLSWKKAMGRLLASKWNFYIPHSASKKCAAFDWSRFVRRWNLSTLSWKFRQVRYHETWEGFDVMVTLKWRN